MPMPMHYNFTGPQHCDFCAHRYTVTEHLACCPEAYEAAKRDGYPVHGAGMVDGRLGLIITLDEQSGSQCGSFEPRRHEELVPIVGLDAADEAYGVYRQ